MIISQEIEQSEYALRLAQLCRRKQLAGRQQRLECEIRWRREGQERLAAEQAAVEAEIIRLKREEAEHE